MSVLEKTLKELDCSESELLNFAKWYYDENAESN